MKKCCQDYLDEQFGDPDVAGEIYEEYMRSIDEKLAELDAALANTDWKRLDRAAHTIKGNALATGDREMADTAMNCAAPPRYPTSQEPSPSPPNSIASPTPSRRDAAVPDFRTQTYVQFP